MAEDYIAAHESSWRNDKHRAQWRSTLETYAYPAIGALPVSQVSRDHVLGVLKPIWKTKTETAKRLRGRIETVLDFAIANDWRGEPNPARWRGHLAKLLPPPSRLAPVTRPCRIPKFRHSCGPCMRAPAWRRGHSNSRS